MPVVPLRHHPLLRLPAARNLPPLPPAPQAEAGAAPLYSFRHPAAPTTRPRIVDATSRLTPAPTPEIHTWALERDSPLAPLLLWDLAHALPVGGTLIAGDTQPGDDRPGYLDRPYFQPALHAEPTRTGRRYHKRAPLPVEADRGLDAWTFAIPTGPGDPTLLNAIVARILALGVPRLEILLCGRPGPGFAHHDAVRIVGEDLPPPPPLNIAAKKNRLAAEASHPNLCILHDRVMLPRGFLAAMRRFGDDYPMLGLQTLYFDDQWGLVPRRYADLSRILRPPAREFAALGRIPGAPVGPFAPALLAEMEASGFTLSHPLRHTPDRSFVNGGLYIAKRATWRLCPQDEGILWTEFEDVEHGLRAAAHGIPARCNPYAFAQSLLVRPIMTLAGSFPVERASGGIGQIRALTEPLPIPRKPLLRVSAPEAAARLRRFVARHVPSGAGLEQNTELRGAAGVRARFAAVLAAIHGAALPRTPAAIATLLDDYDRWLLLDQLPYQRRRAAAAALLRSGSGARSLLAEHSMELAGMLALRPRGPLFQTTPADFLPQGTRRYRLSLPLTALLLWATRRRHVWHPDGLRGLLHALRDCMPGDAP